MFHIILYDYIDDTIIRKYNNSHMDDDKSACIHYTR